MESRYRSEKEILDSRRLVRRCIYRAREVDACRASRRRALLDRDSFDAALDRMKAGLMNLLIHGFKVDLEKEMPYHETLTVFWMRAVDTSVEAKTLPQRMAQPEVYV